MKQGFAYGETADEHPCKTISKPVHIEDLHATLYEAMGISPRQSYTVERRPFTSPATETGKRSGNVCMIPPRAGRRDSTRQDGFLNP